MNMIQANKTNTNTINCILSNFITCTTRNKDTKSDGKRRANILIGAVLIYNSKKDNQNGEILYIGYLESIPLKFKIFKDLVLKNSASVEILNESNKFVFLNYKKHLILPALYDMHFHWVQDEVCLKPKANLLKWLEKYTWPYENKFKNKQFSEQKAKLFAKKLARAGTIGGAIYSSIHQHASEHAFKYFKGDFIVGNVLMTMNSPQYLQQTQKEANKIISTLSKRYKERYAITPRFAITTDPTTMKAGASLASINNNFIQTHLSETKNECNFVLDIYKKIKNFEDVENYTEIYNRCNLLTDKSIFGHGIHLSDQELKLLSQKKCMIAHCPTSNDSLKKKGLGSGLFDYKKANKLKVQWALGSDIGGGPFLSMFDVMNSFVKQNREASYQEALYHSTIEASKFLRIKNSGSLENGNYANFILLAKMNISQDSFNKNLTNDLQNNYIEKILKRLMANSPRYKLEDIVLKTVYHGEELFPRSMQDLKDRI